MRLRQIALVAHDLDPVVSALCESLEVDVAFRDPGVAEFGLHNALMPIGDTFLEVVSPTREGTSAGRLLERRGGDGGYMVILQSDDLDSNRKRLEELDVRIVWEFELEDIATLHLHPKDIGGALLSLDVADPPSSWRWAGPDWESHVRSETSEWLTGAEIQTSDPRATAHRWAEIIDSPVIDPDDGHFELPLDAGSLRFVETSDGRGDGVSAIEVQVRDAERVLANARRLGLETGPDHFAVCGTRIDLRTVAKP
jgi:hypothetical protein